MNQKPSPIHIARGIFSEIAGKLPQLKMEEDENAQVEISLTIAEQEGLKHKVWLCLQNNYELHFSVGSNSAWEWCPCTDPVEAASYIDAVTGFLEGKYRALEHYRGKKRVRVELQKLQGSDWKTIRTLTKVALPFPRKKTYQEIRNI